MFQILNNVSCFPSQSLWSSCCLNPYVHSCRPVAGIVLGADVCICPKRMYYAGPLTCLPCEHALVRSGVIRPSGCRTQEPTVQGILVNWDGRYSSVETRSVASDFRKCSGQCFACQRRNEFGTWAAKGTAVTRKEALCGLRYPASFPRSFSSSSCGCDPVVFSRKFAGWNQ